MCVVVVYNVMWYVVGMNMRVGKIMWDWKYIFFEYWKYFDWVDVMCLVKSSCIYVCEVWLRIEWDVVCLLCEWWLEIEDIELLLWILIELVILGWIIF